MRLVHKQPVHAQLLKGNDIILAGTVIQFCKPCTQGFFCFFHLFDGITLPFFCLCCFCGNLDLCNLFFYDHSLPFNRKRDFFKLTVTDDNGIIFPGCDTGTEPFPVGWLKVFFGGCKDICTRIKP